MKLKLCKTNFTPSPISVIGDFDPGEADFDGYAAATITFGAPYIDGSGNVVAVASVSFHCTGNTTPNNLYVFYMTDTAGTGLIGSGRLDGAPIPISGSGDGLSLVIIISLGGGTVDVVG